MPLTVGFKPVSARECARLKAWSVYLWQCDAAGRYSMYDRELEREDHLRGVQLSDTNG